MRKIVLLLASMALVVFAGTPLLLMLSSTPAYATTTFTVNRSGDRADRNLTDSKCDTSRTTGLQCTLRAAIQEANDTPNSGGPDLINFNIGGTTSVKTINVGSTGLGQLPAITQAVTINGYTQPGAQQNILAEGDNAVLKVQLNGTYAGTSASGIRFDMLSIGSTVKGLVINRFSRYGVHMKGTGAVYCEFSNSNVLGNFIGTNASGTQDLGNGSDGVYLEFTISNAVGGTSPAARNVISGNGGNGVRMTGFSFGADCDAPSALNKVKGNYIGTDKSGTADLGNTSNGVFLDEYSPYNTIGGNTSAASNIISGNGADGVKVSYETGNSILSNSIFSNDGLGIDLGAEGVTLNDTGDPDIGANNLQNFPVIASAVRDSITGTTTITGTLNSNPNQTYTIQCFDADTDSTNHGEGETYLAQDTTVTTNADGKATFTCTTTSNALVVGDEVSATATNTSSTATLQETGDTSEFSQNVVVTSST